MSRAGLQPLACDAPRSYQGGRVPHERHSDMGTAEMTSSPEAGGPPSTRSTEVHSGEPKCLPRPHRDDRESELIAMLRGAQLGDEVAFGVLIERLDQPLRQTFRRRSAGSPVLLSLEDDVLQETLLRVVRGIHQCKAQSAPELMSWAWTILSRVAYDVARKNFPRYTAVEFVRVMSGHEARHEYRTWSSSGDAHQGALWHASRILESVLSELPEKDQDLLLARIVTEETATSIAERAAIGPSGVRTRCMRLLRRIREEVLDRVESLPTRERSEVMQLLNEEGA